VSWTSTAGSSSSARSSRASRRAPAIGLRTTRGCRSDARRAVAMRHRIKHHVNRPVLHMGLFTDAQMLPAAGLFTLAAGWFYAGGGGLVARTVVCALLMLPVAVMVVDNRVGGIVVDRVRAFV